MTTHSGRTILAAHGGAGLFGADRMLLQSVAGLRESDCTVVVALPTTGPLAEELERLGAQVEIIEMMVLRTPLLRPRRWPAAARRSLLGLRNIWRLLSRLRPDPVYVSTSTIPQWPLLARLRGLHTISHLYEAERSRGRWANRLQYLPHLGSQRTLVNSRYTLETIRHALPALARRAEIVHNGIASPLHPALPREPLEAPLRVVYVGRLTPRKGADLALEASTLLQRDGHEVRLTILGPTTKGFSGYAQRLRHRAAGSGLAVDLPGFQQDVWPFLAAADVLVAPSRLDEPFGNAAVEAVLALRPVIASSSSGLREAVGGYRTARPVPPGDARAIADALVELTETWSKVVLSLSASREEAQRRHDPATYRATIARACGVEDTTL